MKKIMNINELEIGQKINYGFFNNITFEGLDNLGQVILKDKLGNIKKVSEYLFMKYASIAH